jgi:hypothetical protein
VTKNSSDTRGIVPHYGPTRMPRTLYVARPVRLRLTIVDDGAGRHEQRAHGSLHLPAFVGTTRMLRSPGDAAMLANEVQPLVKTRSAATASRCRDSPARDHDAAEDGIPSPRVPFTIQTSLSSVVVNAFTTR